MEYYEVKVDYERQTGEDNPAHVKELYLVEAVNCADAETTVTEELKPYVFGSYETPSCKKMRVFDIFNNPDDGVYWYKARVELITLTDDGKEKRKAVNMFVAGPTIEGAVKLLRSNIGQLDCEITAIAKTNIVDILHAMGATGEPADEPEEEEA